jgi:hypothetical protein
MDNTNSYLNQSPTVRFLEESIPQKIDEIGHTVYEQISNVI